MLAATTLLAVGAQAQEMVATRVALVIGNSAYESAPLQAALVDARSMSETLKARGFTVIDARDATLGQMRAALAQARAVLGGRRGIGVLYFAGHGLQSNWHNYLVPVNARIAAPQDIAAEAMDVQEVIDGFKAAGNRMNIVILDACRDGPFTPMASGRGLAQLDAPPGMFLAFAAAPGNVVAPTAPGGGDLYARSLVEELKKPQVKLEDVFNRARLRVRQQSDGRQTPWESTSLEDNLFLDPDGKARLVATRQLAATPEMEDWELSKSSARDIRSFLLRHPDGLLNEVARIYLEQIEQEGGVARSESMPDQFVAGNTRFFGHFVKDAGGTGISGSGRVYWANGDSYDGELVAGRREGKGSFVWPSGQRFSGQWHDDQPNGTGLLEFIDGARYEGAVVDGAPHGRGVYTWADGRRLDATWTRGEANGSGEIRFVNGDVYRGGLAVGKPNGTGRFVYASGDQYIGTFKDGLPDGEGSYTWKSGDTFVGTWRDGLRNGPAVLTRANGDRWTGSYRDDHQGEGELIRAVR